MVCYLHSYYPEANEYVVAGGIQRILTGLFQLANPFFFLLSGFLFFNQLKGLKDCFVKIKKRIRTLVIPYLLWNLITVFYFFTLYFLSPISINSDIVPTITNGTLIEILHRVFVEPAGFQLWFLRDLIGYVFISPILFIGMKYLSYFIPLILLLLDYQLHQGNLFFFVLGGSVAMNTSLERLDLFLRNRIFRFSIIILFVIYCVMTILKVNNIVSWGGVPLQLIGVISVWAGTSILCKKNLLQNKFIASICGYSFFIYCFHMPTLNILKKMGLYLIGTSEISYITCFLINPILIVMLSIAIAKLLNKYCPTTYKILSGGR